MRFLDCGIGTRRLSAANVGISAIVRHRGIGLKNSRCSLEKELTDVDRREAVLSLVRLLYFY